MEANGPIGKVLMLGLGSASPLQGACIQWNRALPRWFEHHPAIHTLFVVQDSGGKWLVPRGRNDRPNKDVVLKSVKIERE